MTNTPITDINGYFSAIAQPKGIKNEEASPDESFRNVMDNVFKDTIDMPVRSSDSAYRGNEFSEQNPQDTAADSATGAKRDIAKNEKMSRANEKSNRTDTGREKTVREDKTDRIKTAEEKIVKTVAKKLGVSEQQLQDFMAELGLTTADLMNPENINLLATTILADGDMTSLLTDENLFATVQDLNQQIEVILQQTGEELQMSVADLKEMATSLEEALVTDGNEHAEEVVVEKVVLQDKNVTDAKETVTEKTATDTQENTEEGTEKVQSISDAKPKQEDAPMHDHSRRQEGDAQSQAMATPGVLQDNSVTSGTPQVNSYTQAVPMAQDIFQQVSQQIRSNVNQLVTELQMQLNPENLGTVGLTVSSKEGNVTAHFTTQDETVRAALESQIALLKENLEQQGVKVTAVEVTVASHEFEQNLEKGNEENAQQEEEAEKLRKATRKIDLTGITDDEMPEELDEADAVTAKMMRADGNSMDYKV